MGTVTIKTNEYSVYSTTANAFADASEYLDGKIGNANWESALTDDRQRALVSATRWVIRALASRGLAEASIPDPADIPADTFLSEATYEAAFFLISNASAIDSQSQDNNKKRVKAGSAEIEYFRPQSGGILPSTAQALIMRYLNSVGSTSTGLGALASGVDGCSEFLDQDRFGRREGYP